MARGGCATDEPVTGNASDGRVTRAIWLVLCRAMISVGRIWEDADVSQAMLVRHVETLGRLGRDARVARRMRYGSRLKTDLLLGSQP
jgi:hypothetical protein